jgi:hypothetical protein
MALMFLLGFLPTFILYRARLWSVRRRLEAESRPVQVQPASTPVEAEDAAAAI